MAKTKDEKDRDKTARKTRRELAQTLDNTDGLERVMSISVETWKELQSG